MIMNKHMRVLKNVNSYYLNIIKTFLDVLWHCHRAHRSDASFSVFFAKHKLT